MFSTLYRPEHNACHGQRPRRVACAADLPPDLIGVVVPPVRFDVHRDREIVADRSLGLDAQGQACWTWAETWSLGITQQPAERAPRYPYEWVLRQVRHPALMGCR